MRPIHFKTKSVKQKCLFSFIFIILALVGTINEGQANVYKDKGKGKEDFPQPTEVKDLLFYVQRTINVNTLVYTLNVDKDGALNVNEPIKINWINYATNGSTEPLNYIQRRYAYGVDVQLLDKEKETFAFNFVSYKKKSIYLIKSQTDNKYHAYYATAKDGLIILDRIFIKIEGGAFWTPIIKYIEVSGVNLKNEKIVEKVIP